MYNLENVFNGIWDTIKRNVYYCYSKRKNTTSMTSSPTTTPTSTTTPIKHVVLVVLENRSFDQIFGYRNDYPKPFKVNGIKNANSKKETDRLFNLDKNNKKIYQNPMNAFTGEDDSVHDLYSTLRSINGIDYGYPKMSGFVLANQLELKSNDNAEQTVPIRPEEIMGYFPKGSFPLYEYIANNFTLCDNWFASAPTCTLPNRAFGLCGTSDGHINNCCKGVNQKILYKCDTIFDRLDEKNVSWKVYFNDFPLTLTLEHQLRCKNIKNYTPFSKFKRDILLNTLPAFSVIEPEYGIESNSKKINSIMNGQTLIADILSSLQSKPALWESTLVVVYYDESGGFFDHVYPPDAPEVCSPDTNYTFGQYGCRVPAMLISPRIPVGVDSTLYDHTSVLKFVQKNWNVRHLTERDKQANDFSHLISNTVRKNILSVSEFDFGTGSLGMECTYSTNTEFFKKMIESHFVEILADIGKLNYKLYNVIVRSVKMYTRA